MFESTWDPGRYKEYISSTSFSNAPGSKNMLEQKSFFGSKVMKTPNIIKESLQLKYDSSIADVFNVQPDLYPKYEIIWEETPLEIKALLLVDRTAIKHFNNGGIGKKFYSLLVSEFGVGSETLLSDDVDEYVKLNIIPQYEAKEIGVWIKKIQKTDGIDLPPIVSNLADFDKMKNGFVKSTNNNITNNNTTNNNITNNNNNTFNIIVINPYNDPEIPLGIRDEIVKWLDNMKRNDDISEAFPKAFELLYDLHSKEDMDKMLLKEYKKAGIEDNYEKHRKLLWILREPL
jgi:hypothetical protein